MDFNALFVGTIILIVLAAWFVSSQLMKHNKAHDKVPFTSGSEPSDFHVDTDPGDDNRFI